MSEKHEQIRERAHEIWEAEGRPDGRDGEHWREAERQLAEPGASPANQAEDAAAHETEAAISSAEGADLPQDDAEGGARGDGENAGRRRRK
jgi:hypothetical protein